MTIYITKADAKLYRGEQAQAVQLDRTRSERRADGLYWSDRSLSPEDRDILARRAYPHGTFGNRTLHDGAAYLNSLNA